MKKNNKNSLQLVSNYKQPVLFYSLATLIPWMFWFLAGYLSHITPSNDMYIKQASIVAFIGLLFPAIVAFWLIKKESGLHNDFYNRFFNFRTIKPIYFIISLFLMLASILLAQAISLLFGHSASQFVITGNFTFSSGVFPVWVLLIVSPAIEELAWHSYGTDCLRNRFNLFKTSLVFGIFWGLWHIPLSFINNYYHSNVVETGWIYSVNFLISIIPFVFIMNWLYYKTNRNILLTIIFHITAGFFNEIFSTHPDSKVIQTGLLLVLAIVIVLKDKEFFFKREFIE